MENENKEEKIELRVKEALGFGWKKTRQRFLFFAAAVFIFILVPVLITLPLDIMAVSMEGASERLVTSASVIIHFLIQMLLTAGFITILLKTLREEGGSLKDFMGKGDFVLRLTGGYLLYSLAVLVGFIFFIVPGIFLAVRLNFFDFLIVDKGMRPVEALKASYTITEGYGWKIFLLVFVAAPLLFILGAMAFFIGILVATPVIFLAQTFFYAKLVTRREELSQV